MHTDISVERGIDAALFNCISVWALKKLLQCRWWASISVAMTVKHEQSLEGLGKDREEVLETTGNTDWFFNLPRDNSVVFQSKRPLKIAGQQERVYHSVTHGY